MSITYPSHHHLLTYAKLEAPMHYKRVLHVDIRIEFTHDPNRVMAGTDDNPFDIVDVVYKTWNMKAWEPMPDYIRSLFEIDEQSLTSKFEETIAQIGLSTQSAKGASNAPK